MYKVLKKIHFVIVSSFLLTSCSSIHSLNNKHSATNKIGIGDSMIEFESVVDQYPMPTRKIASIESDSTIFDLDYSKGKYKFWLKYYSKKKNKERFLRQMNRGFYYKNIIEDIFAYYKIPKELFFVGLIESGYLMNAKSHAKAMGPWQFMKGTGKHYNLKVNWYMDERKNLIKSTHASANYFKDLYNIFGSWELALCAYNAGEYRIIRAIRKGNTRDYKLLVKKGILPKETVYYIPKIMAGKTMYARFKHHLNDSKEFNLNDYRRIKLRGVRSLKKLSQKIKISYEVIKNLNPEYVGKRLPSRKSLTFMVPNSVSKIYKFPTYKKKKKIKKRNNYSKRKRKVATTNRVKNFFFYKVQRGDNLTFLKKLFKSTIHKIKKINKISRNKIYKGQRLKIPSKSIIYYKVKKGDNLLRIARKFNKTIHFIKRVNRIVGEKIFLGQKLTIPNV